MPETLEKFTLDSLPPDPHDRELVPSSDPRAGVISANLARVSGTPCFAGTRVPIRNLWDYLENGTDNAEFLDDFPGVSQEQVRTVLRQARERLLEGLPPDTCHTRP